MMDKYALFLQRLKDEGKLFMGIATNDYQAVVNRLYEKQKSQKELVKLKKDRSEKIVKRTKKRDVVFQTELQRVREDYHVEEALMQKN